MTDDDRCFALSDLGDGNQRLDALVSAHIGECSRSLAADLIRKGRIRVGTETKKPGYRPKPGEVIRGCIPRPRPIFCEPEPVPLAILFEDRDLIVLDKAPGQVVHPAPGHGSGTIVHGLLHHCPDLEGIGGELRPGIVHRLDKGTSGILVVAKNSPALAGLAAQFKARTVRKRYLALVHGEMRNFSGSITLPIGRHPRDRKRMSTISRSGKPAETLWTVRERYTGAALLDIDLMTGRTHQIRVHCAAIHHPVVGDPVYCGRPDRHLPPRIFHILKSPSRQMLHAERIEFTHPRTDLPLTFQTLPPADMRRLIQHLQIMTEEEVSWPE